MLEAAHAQGHQVTVIATKEEAFKDLDEAATKCGAAIHWISIGELGACIRLLTEAGVSHAVMAGQVPGRTSDEQVTFYRNVGNQGLQFSAVGQVVYRKAVEAGVGHEIPTEWFLQDIRD